ncbi:MAG: immune inhibitor A [Chloroflexi bacterium]|nr:immune inhibitor A [Chloroflexota bacterium]
MLRTSWLVLALVAFLAVAPACLGPRPAPEATPEATATATPSVATAVVPGTPAVGEASPPPERDLYALAERLRLKSGQPAQRVVNAAPVSYQEGRKDVFWVTNVRSRQVRQVTATLKLVSPHAYWYVDDAVNMRVDALRASARVFEEEVYPRVTAAFGTEWTPGVDNDIHLTILHTVLQGLAGYYSSSDEYPASVHPYSNQREMIYIDSGAVPPGTREYLGTLAHELAHAIQWNADAAEETWVNEGLAEVAKELAGYPLSFRTSFLAMPYISLTLWPGATESSGPHYGGASLFLLYLMELYGGAEGLRVLQGERLDGIRGVEAYLRRAGVLKGFREVFGDWIVANYLDDPRGGVYSYPQRNLQVTVSSVVNGPGTVKDEAQQYGARYFDLQLVAPQTTVTFQGQAWTPLFPDPTPDGGRCWWSNRGDSIDSTLTAKFSLPAREGIVLSYSLWYDVEEGWDYAYVEASTDGGATWDILAGELSSPVDPVGNAFGPGYTGESRGWRQDQVDLTRYAGREVLVRFEYVTDDAIHGAGLCLDQIAIPSLGFLDDAEDGDGVWEALGFVRVENRVPQTYVVRLIEMGERPSVRAIELDSEQKATFSIQGLGSRVPHAVLVVAPTAERTTLPATFEFQITAVPGG